MNVKNLMTRAAVVAAVSLPSFAALAEESSGTGSSDATAETLGEGIINSAQTALTSMLNSAAPAILAIVASGLAIWAGIAVIGVLKRAFSAGKGR